MNYSINNLNLLDSGNLNLKHINSNEAGPDTLLPVGIYDKVINVGPVYTGCNLDIARKFSEEDLRALEFEIPDGYLHHCLESNYLSLQNGYLSVDNGPLVSEVNESVPSQPNPPCEIEKSFISGKQSFRSFLVKEFQDLTKQIQKTVSYKLRERGFLFTDKDYRKHEELYSKFDEGNLQNYPSQSFGRTHMAFKQSPLIEIDNLGNKTNVSSKTADTFVKLKHFTKHGSLDSEVSGSMPVQSESSNEVEKEFITCEQSFESFLVKEFQDSSGQIPSQSFRRRYVAPKQSPLIEIDNLINKIKVSSKTTEPFVERNHFTNVWGEIKELNANITRMTSKHCSKEKTRLSKKERKPRMKLTTDQLLYLKMEFAENHYLTSERAKVLSKRLGISEICLKTWFQNQRARYKRMTLNRRTNFNCREGSGGFPTQRYGRHKRNMDNRVQKESYKHSVEINREIVNESINNSSSDWHDNGSSVYSNGVFLLGLDSFLESKY